MICIFIHICINYFTDKKFLAFFFKHLKINNTGRYTNDFPFLSICGVERNYVRCDDLPLVFTKVIQKRNVEINAYEDWFSYAHADDLLMVILKIYIVNNYNIIYIIKL